MSSERGRSTPLYGGHGFELPEFDMAYVSLTPTWTVVAEYIRHLYR